MAFLQFLTIRLIGNMTESGRDIPEHVLFDILLWLPVVSLLRFKHTCKYWCALIESSTFITEHLHHSNSNSEEALIVCGKEVIDYNSGTSEVLLMLIDGDEYKKCSKHYMQKLLPSGIVPYYGLVGSCDGIVCLRTSCDGNLALYNPAVKQLRHIPEPLFLTPPTGAGSRFDIVGFGFDSKTNDYKVVRILFYADKPSRGGHNIKIVEVYSKRTDSWRTLHITGASLPFALLFHYPHTTSKSGTCFWIGEETVGTCNLVSFDLNDEVFGAMPLPDSGSFDISCALDFLNDKLVYIMGVGRTTLSKRGHHYQSFEIWMLHEFGIKESWNKIYKIGPIPRFIYSPVEEYYYPIRLSKSGEFVILMRCEDLSKNGNAGELHVFNLRTQDKNYPLIHPPNCWANDVFKYEESLVSVKSL